MIKGKLYLIPSLLSESTVNEVIPVGNILIIRQLKEFIVEEIRTARRFLKKVDKEIDISGLNFYLLNEHTSSADYHLLLKPALEGKNIGLLSEAGMPCIADPGAVVVKLAHEKNIEVVPLTGPSSIMLALSASGLNGQNFCFHGYLPIDKTQRINKIKEIEKSAFNTGQTQIFMETPYRNRELLDSLLNTCRSNTLLCLAVNITGENALIHTATIAFWKKNLPDIHKKPAIFIIAVS